MDGQLVGFTRGLGCQPSEFALNLFEHNGGRIRGDRDGVRWSQDGCVISPPPGMGSALCVCVSTRASALGRRA